MEFIKSWKFMAILVAIIAAAVIAMLIYGITTHTEPGFMAETPGFSRGDAPLHVCTTAYTGTDPDEARAAVRRAVQVTNERLGFSVFVEGAPTSPCSVNVTVGVPSEQGHRDPGGDAVFHAGQRHCEVTTNNTGTTEMLGLVLQHELGHCLGLDHDCYEGSIMCGGACCTLAPTPDSAWPPRISDSDHNILQSAYAPEGGP